MPTPIAHSLTNLSICYAVKKGSWKNNKGSLDIRGIGIFLFLGILLDLDFLPGILLGDLNRFHHMGTHSLLFAFLISVIIAPIIPFFTEGASKKILFLKNSMLYFAMLLQHMTLDYFTVDTSSPYGIELFWPKEGYYIFSNPFFPTFDRSAERLLKVDNLLNLLVELIIFGALFITVYLLCKQIFRKKGNS